MLKYIDVENLKKQYVNINIKNQRLNNVLF